MIGASAALALSGLPVDATMGAVRVGYKNGQFLLNPGAAELKDSELDLVVAGTEDAVLMVESEAKELPESVMLDAVYFGHEAIRKVTAAIDAFADEAGVKIFPWQPPQTDESLKQNLEEVFGRAIEEAYGVAEKQARHEKLDAIRADAVSRFAADDTARANAIKSLFKELGSPVHPATHSFWPAAYRWPYDKNRSPHYRQTWIFAAHARFGALYPG